MYLKTDCTDRLLVWNPSLLDTHVTSVVINNWDILIKERMCTI